MWFEERANPYSEGPRWTCAKQVIRIEKTANQREEYNKAVKIKGTQHISCTNRKELPVQNQTLKTKY